MPLNKKTVKYYLANQEVGSTELVPPPVEEIHCVSILDLISKLIERMQEMQHQIETNSKEIQNMNRSVEND